MKENRELIRQGVSFEQRMLDRKGLGSWLFIAKKNWWG